MHRVLWLLALVAACDGAHEEDLLVDRIAVAHKIWDGTLIEFGSPRALPHLSEVGWSHGETAPDGNTFRWAIEQSASFTFPSEREGKHLAWLECEPFRYQGSPTQWIAVSVNGEPVTEIELRPGRERYPVELPLTRGTNTVVMQFRYAGDPNRSSADRRRLAAAFYRFDIPPEGEEPVAGRSGPFAWVDRGLRLPPGGGMTVYADLSERARLVVDTHGGGLRVRARARGRTLVETELDTAASWQESFEAMGPVALTFHADDEVVMRASLIAPVEEPERRARRAVDADIILVVLDGANALRLGPEVTPVLDRLAKESVVFETAVSQAVYTIASIGSVLTGQYPERHQSVSFADKLREDAVTFPALLSEEGYRTAGFSGNAVASRTFGLDQGYQEFVQVWEQKSYTGHGDSVLKAFGKWHEKLGNERFFAYVHFREPHFPYNPPPPYDTRFGPGELFRDGLSDKAIVDELNASGTPPEDVVSRVRALYHGNLAYVDHLVGELLRLLDEDTIVVVTSDHGEALFEHGFLGHNTQLYDESIRVPLIIKMPGEPARRVTDVVELVDLAPTILELAGIAPEDMQGRSLWAPTDEDRIAFSRTVWIRPRYSARTDHAKLIWDSRTGAKELYDLQNDPNETRNALDADAFTAGYLEQELFAWLRTQEHLRAGAPDRAEMTEAERKRIESLGYTEFVKETR